MAQPAHSLLHFDGALEPHALAEVFEAFPHAMATLSVDGRIMVANHRWLLTDDDPLLPNRVGANLVEHLESIDDQHAAIAEHIRDGLGRVLLARTPSFEFQYELRPVGGLPRWFLLTAATLGDGGAVVTHTDTTAHHTVQDVLAEMAFHDTLTGLPNRILVLDRIRTALARAGRTAQFPAVIFIDLDGFKAVNDEFGHATGDRVLVEVSHRLAGAVREGDTCGRWGGDEFVLVIDLTDPATVDGLIQRIRDAFAESIVVDEHAIDIGLSIGVVLSQHADGVDQLVRRADEAMYLAKRTGAGVRVVSALPPNPPVIELP